MPPRVPGDRAWDGRSQFFRNAHNGAAGSHIAGHFGVTGSLCFTHTTQAPIQLLLSDRKVRGHGIALLLATTASLHQPIFQRVKADAHKAPTGGQLVYRLLQHRLQIRQLVINVDTNSLESARGWTLSFLPGRIGVFDNLRQTPGADRKSTRLNSSHVAISYAVFCVKKEK